MTLPEGAEQAQITADAVARRSYGKLVAFLVARTHDVAAAEDALSEAFAAALTNWPLTGCPQNPEGLAAHRRAPQNIDSMRRRRRDDPHRSSCKSWRKASPPQPTPKSLISASP